MKDRSPDQPAPELLPEAEAARLLGRASELDVERRAGSALSDLRAAATEAGISAGAFDAALAEMQGEATAPVTDGQLRTRRRSPVWILVAALAGFVGLIAFYSVGRLVPSGASATSSVPVVEEGILLRCIAPGDAAALVRPLLTLPSNTMVVSPAAPRVLTIRATREQLDQVRAALAKYEGDGTSACVTP